MVFAIIGDAYHWALRAGRLPPVVPPPVEPPVEPPVDPPVEPPVAPPVDPPVEPSPPEAPVILPPESPPVEAPAPTAPVNQSNTTAPIAPPQASQPTSASKGYIQNSSNTFFFFAFGLSHISSFQTCCGRIIEYMGFCANYVHYCDFSCCLLGEKLFKAYCSDILEATSKK